MIRGFRDVNGVAVPFAEIDYVRDAARFNCSPASLAMLIDSVHARRDVDFSASQLGVTARQHLLRSMDYYPPTAQAMSGYMGTVKHQQMNVERPRLIVEQRYTSKLYPELSGQIDHAAVVANYADDVQTVDLYDLKGIKWYSTTLCAKDVWKNHPDYAWQMNLCAVLMEEHGYKVRNMYLECIPPDATYKHAAEAAKLGLPEYQKVIIKIDRKSAKETYRVFLEAMAVRDWAIASGVAPLCPDRWSNRDIDNLRCRHYCDVRDECIKFQHDKGESHPVAPLDVALEASIAEAKR